MGGGQSPVPPAVPGALAGRGRGHEGLRFQLRNEPEVRARPGAGREPNFPLGWTLSQRTERQMERQAGCNPELVQVCRLMGEDPAAPGRCDQLARELRGRCRGSRSADPATGRR